MIRESTTFLQLIILLFNKLMVLYHHHQNLLLDELESDIGKQKFGKDFQGEKLSKADWVDAYRTATKRSAREGGHPIYGTFSHIDAYDGGGIRGSVVWPGMQIQSPTTKPPVVSRLFPA